MRFISILSLVTTFVIGVSVAQLMPTRMLPITEWVRPLEWLYPSFSSEETNSMVGLRVRCAYRTDNFLEDVNLENSGR